MLSSIFFIQTAYAIGAGGILCNYIPGPWYTHWISSIIQYLILSLFILFILYLLVWIISLFYKKIKKRNPYQEILKMIILGHVIWFIVATIMGQLNPDLNTICSSVIIPGVNF